MVERSLLIIIYPTAADKARLTKDVSNISPIYLHDVQGSYSIHMSTHHYRYNYTAFLSQHSYLYLPFLRQMGHFGRAVPQT